MNKPSHVIQGVLKKEVDRKEFLRLALVAGLGIVGISRLLENVDRDVLGNSSGGDRFGQGTYGGNASAQQGSGSSLGSR